jgi:hypothetical protein
MPAIEAVETIDPPPCARIGADRVLDAQEDAAQADAWVRSQSSTDECPPAARSRRRCRRC